MKLEDFEIGVDFRCGGCMWRCTDIGTRVIAGILISGLEDSSWLNGPPYLVAEFLFDENSQKDCTLKG